MALDIHTAAFADEIHTLATLDIGEMWDRQLGEFLGEWTRVNRQNLPADEMEKHLLSFMEDLSGKPTEDLARKSSTVAYNQGRNAEIKTAHAEGEVQYVVRSEILDEATCSECAKWDGAIFEVGTPEFDQYAPPAQCLGGDRCRGFYVAVPAKMESE